MMRANVNRHVRTERMTDSIKQAIEANGDSLKVNEKATTADLKETLISFDTIQTMLYIKVLRESICRRRVYKYEYWRAPLRQ